MNTHYNFVCDPSHGWLAVSHDDIANVGLGSASFSEYSYMTALGMYLEEDSDANRFIIAYTERNGKAPKIGEINYRDDCYVRDLPRNNEEEL